MSDSIAVHSRASWSTYREVFALAYPVVLAMLAFSLLGLTDTLFMGWVGTAAQAGVGLGGMVTWTAMALFSGTLNAVNTFVSQHFGAERPRECGAYAWHGLYLALLFSCAAPALAPLVTGLIRRMGTSGAAAEIAASYAAIRIWAMPLRMVEVTLTSFLQGTGDTRTPAKATFVAVLVHVPLNYWFVFGGLGLPALGPDGAAYSTVLSSAVSVGLLIIATLRPSLRARYASGRPATLSIDRLRSLLGVGLPIGVLWFFETATWMVFSAFVERFGAVALASHNIVMQWLHISFMPGIGLSIAATTLVGQSLGAGDSAAAWRRGRAALILAMAFMSAMGLLYLVAGDLIARGFSQDAAVIRVCRVLFMLAAAFQTFDALGMISGGILRGAGDTRWPMVVSTLFSWGVFIPLTWLIGHKLKGGVTGAWVAATIYIFGLGLLLYARVAAGAWRTRRLVTLAPPG